MMSQNSSEVLGRGFETNGESSQNPLVPKPYGVLETTIPGDLGQRPSTSSGGFGTGEVLGQTRDTDPDPRHSCKQCQHGGYRRCPDGNPLPFDILHNCLRFRARDPGARPAKPAPVDASRIGLPTSHRAFRAWLDLVHAEDAALGVQRLMRTGA